MLNTFENILSVLDNVKGSALYSSCKTEGLQLGKLFSTWLFFRLFCSLLVNLIDLCIFEDA